MDFVGIDLHNKTISLCAVNQERKVLERKRFYCSDIERILELFQEIGPFQAVVEAITGYEWLVKAIEQIGSRADLTTQEGLYREMVERQQRLFTQTAEALQWD